MFNLEEAKEVIAKKTEFSCNERVFGYVIDYHVSLADTFTGSTPRETLILQNLRGTCFDHNGNIIRLAYHKFHNLNENPEYAAANFDFSQSHIIQEKLDGSMVTPIPYVGGWMFGTRAGFTDVAAKADKLLESWRETDYEKYEAYHEFVLACFDGGITPIFEFCSREQRIVIDYPEPKLVLTDIRGNGTGEYYNIYSAPRNIPHANKRHGLALSTITEYASVIKELKGEEGVVVKFADGRFVKIKAEDYCLKHRALDGLRFEKDVLKLILTNQIDDVLPLVAPDVKERLEKYRESVVKRIIMANQEIKELFERNRHVASKKRFAEIVMSSPYKTGLFKMWDGHEYDIKDFVLSKCGSITGVEEARWIIGKSYLEF